MMMSSVRRRVTAAAILLGGLGLAAVSHAAVADLSPEGLPASVGPGAECVVDIRLYDPIPVSSMLLQVGWIANCMSLVDDASLTPRPLRPGRMDIVFPDGFEGPSTFVRCEIFYFDDECPASSIHQLWLEFGAGTATGLGGTPIESLTMCPVRFDCTEWPCVGTPPPYYAGVCADPDFDGVTTATDALFALQAAIEMASCLPEQCDTDNDSLITATDALRILAAALALDVELNCPFPCEARTLTGI